MQSAIVCDRKTKTKVALATSNVCLSPHPIFARPAPVCKPASTRRLKLPAPLANITPRATYSTPSAANPSCLCLYRCHWPALPAVGDLRSLVLCPYRGPNAPWPTCVPRPASAALASSTHGTLVRSTQDAIVGVVGPGYSVLNATRNKRRRRREEEMCPFWGRRPRKCSQN